MKLIKSELIEGEIFEGEIDKPHKRIQRESEKKKKEHS